MSDPISSYVTHLECKLKDMKKELVTQRELANRLEEENADVFLRRWAKAQERAIDAERERDELRSDLEFRRGLFKLQEEQLNGVRAELDRVREERDQYKGLLIRLYNDLFVHHKGEAVREFKELFREENYN